ncbi:MAG: MotA/TolQ/ExbB proton channel family protein [Deltaproteobacteria bacterium]|nr:MotA/TolQ/ExbB proton channel family protein [Deltaproteobacteria bacterium]MBI3387603.1 MotA/TolQ/ExbB proton channel family protein [Deltaproteobacteria bacterium]
MTPTGFLELIEHGGVVMYPLLVCSVVSLAVIVERLWSLRRTTAGSRRLQRVALEALDEGGVTDALAVCRRDDSPLAAVYRAVLTGTEKDADARTRIAQRKLAEAARGLKRFIWLLGTIGSLAPFIGLFGTVLGIIRSFENMAAAGSGGFAVVAGGISEALIATAGGLLVGVLSIFAYNAFIVRINNHAAVLREWADEFLMQLTAPAAREGSHPRVAQSR